MPLLNKQNGNMYSWVTHTANIIRGDCPHQCTYCYMKKFPQGKLRLEEKYFQEDLGKGNTIFFGSSVDMWANEVPSKWISKVLEFCNKYPENVYIFQSKNPERFLLHDGEMPENCLLGTTLETNRDISSISKAPDFVKRFATLQILKREGFETFVSIEPIMKFDLPQFLFGIMCVNPKFVSIGADSKKGHLPEPTKEELETLITELKKFTEVRLKKNLNRILGAK